MWPFYHITRDNAQMIPKETPGHAPLSVFVRRLVSTQASSWCPCHLLLHLSPVSRWCHKDCFYLYLQQCSNLSWIPTVVKTPIAPSICWSMPLHGPWSPGRLSIQPRDIHLLVPSQDYSSKSFSFPSAPPLCCLPEACVGVCFLGCGNFLSGCTT